ncbi:hypothetical protein BLNAU_11222 [Blattamonas nauphoetae]|uniref:Uncharacterized protein n=1 Tax=Blattamonas nauphoetae TaxID=2049346 RepID=A0ABQ9XQK1_9EUKA|nr:hypothetical protein BLNAU_11222 [Blattamonas nauphoetae]
MDTLNDIAQTITSFFITDFSATHVLFDLSETSPLSSFEVFFPETENGEQQANVAVSHCSKQDSTSPSSNLAEHILKQYTVRHPVTLPAPPQPIQAKLSVQTLQPVVSTLSMPPLQGQTSQMKKNAPSFVPRDKGTTTPQSSPHPANIAPDNTPQSSPSIINQQSPLEVSRD